MLCCTAPMTEHMALALVRENKRPARVSSSSSQRRPMPDAPPSLGGFFLFATGVLSALLSLPSLWQFWRRWALAARCAGYGSSKSQMIRAYGRSTQAPTLRISIHMLTLFLASSEAGKLSGRGARGTLLSLLHLLPALQDPPSLPTTATSGNRVLA